MIQKSPLVRPTGTAFCFKSANRYAGDNFLLLAYGTGKKLQKGKLTLSGRISNVPAIRNKFTKNEPKIAASMALFVNQGM